MLTKKGISMRFMILISVAIIIGGCVSSESDKLEQIRKVSQDDAQAYYRLGLHYHSYSQYKSAKKYFEKAILIKPDYAEAHFSLGLAAAGLGEYHFAIEQYKIALKFKPDYWAEAFNQIGSAYREIGYRENGGKKAIEFSLSNFLKGFEKCNDANNTLCLSIIQNIVTTYIDLHSRHSKQFGEETDYLRKAINFAEKALTQANRKNNTYQYAMLQFSLGDAYSLRGGRENSTKALAAYDDALLLLDQKKHSVEYGTVLESIKRLRSEVEENSPLLTETDDKGEKIVIQFVTEKGELLRDAMVSLIELNGDEFIRAHFRRKPVNKNSTISLPATFLKLPKGSLLAVNTKDQFYSHSVYITDFHVIDNYVKIVVPMTGIISGTIVKSNREIKEPLLVRVLRLDEKGSYNKFSGIGIDGSVGTMFTIPGLPTGVYKIQIKEDGNPAIYYQKEGVKVVSGAITHLGEIELNL